MGYPKGTNAAIAEIARLLNEHQKRITKGVVKSRKKSAKKFVETSKLGGRKGQYDLLQNMYLSVLKIGKLAEGPEDDVVDHKMCSLILWIVKKGFQKSKFYDGDGPRQRIHKYSAVLRVAWLTQIDEKNLVRDIFNAGGTEKFAAKWRQYNQDQMEDDD